MQVTLSTNKGTTNLTGTVIVTATVTPPQQAVTPVRCDFYVDGAIKASDTSYPLTFSWDTTLHTDGGHTLRADVVAGNRTRTATLSVGVKNAVTPPPPPPVEAVPVNTVLPAITGTTTQGQVLTVSNGSWAGSPTWYTRQWTRCDAAGANCVDISSATGATYTLTAADATKTIRCWITAFNNVGASAPEETVQTAVVAALAPAVPVNTTPPVITGVATQGNTLIVSNGVWSGSPTSYARQWIRCGTGGESCTDISGATAATYVLTSADAGKTIRCWVTATNSSGDSIPIRTVATAVVVAPPPPPATIVWSAGHETGDMSEWPQATLAWDSGVVLDHKVSSDFARSGSHSMKLTIDTTSGTAGARQARNNEIETGQAYYYSAWYYLPTACGPTGTLWNVFQFKSKVNASTPGSDPIWTIDFQNTPQRPVLAWKGGAFGLAGPFSGDGMSQQDYTQTLTTVPVGAWTHLEVYLKQSTGFTGRITVWHDGVQIFDKNNVRTMHTPGGVPQWSVNNYSTGLSVIPYSLYIDDVVISTSRRGTS